MTRERKIGLLIPFALAALIGAGCVRVGPRIVKAPEPSPAAQAPGAQAFAYLKLNGGSATVQRGDQKAAGKDNAELSSGDRVKVSSGAVSIMYPNSGETRLDAGADVTIVSDPVSRGLIAELRLTAGRAWTRIERLLGADEQFTVAANGVVATVRGTAFGVAVKGDGADVQVADHTVDVVKEIADAAPKSVTVAAGEGVTLSSEQITRLDADKLLALKRKLTDAEMNAVGFRFALTPLSAERLARPANAVQLFQAQPSLTPALEQRLGALRLMVTMRVQQSGFVAPTRAITNPETAPTNVAPSVNGPTQ